MSFLNHWFLLPAACFFLCFLFFRKTSSMGDWYRQMHPAVFSYFNSHNSKQGESKSRYLPILLILTLACLALARPSIRGEEDGSYRHAEGWIVLMDISRSMTLDDIVPSRLSAMRDTAISFIENVGAESVTLIAYAGDAFLLTPPAFDKSLFINTVSILEHGTIPMEGSNLTRALALATSVIENTGMTQAKLVIMGDSGGINTTTRQVVNRLADAGHTTNLLLFGSDTSSDETSLDREASVTLAKAGRGVTIDSSLLGQVNLDPLFEDSEFSFDQFLVRSDLALLRWFNLSHWILLLSLPFSLLLFREE